MTASLPRIETAVDTSWRDRLLVHLTPDWQSIEVIVAGIVTETAPVRPKKCPCSDCQGDCDAYEGLPKDSEEARSDRRAWIRRAITEAAALGQVDTLHGLIRVHQGAPA